MYLPIQPQQTCAAAWLEAAAAVDALPGHEAHNVIIGVSEPMGMADGDANIIAQVDAFLRAGEGGTPLQAVANTIFPDALYRRYGAPAFIDHFQKKLLPKIRKNDRWSGYYFERMTAYPRRDGEPFNQLWNMIERIRDEKNKSLNKFEVSLFDPERDVDNSPYGGQCLSFLSFKLLPGAQKKLALTALYRNHYYIEKLLGNLIGLARLMNFVAHEGGVGVGPLTVISTHAVIDTPRGYRRRDVAELLEACRAAEKVRAAA